jgi:hypothetical protein
MLPPFPNLAQSREQNDSGISWEMQLNGIHHLTAITANARGNYSFTPTFSECAS